MVYITHTHTHKKEITLTPNERIVIGRPAKHGCCYFDAIFAVTSGLRTHLQISREIVLFQAMKKKKKKKTNRNKNCIFTFFHFVTN